MIKVLRLLLADGEVDRDAVLRAVIEAIDVRKGDEYWDPCCPACWGGTDDPDTHPAHVTRPTDARVPFDKCPCPCHAARAALGIEDINAPDTQDG